MKSGFGSRAFGFAIAASIAAIVTAPHVAVAGASVDDAASGIRQQVAFLEQSSRLAVARSSQLGVRAYAAAEAAEQAVVFSNLNAWSDPAAQVADAGADLDASTPVASDAVLTGRSVAIDPSLGSVADAAPAAAPGVIVMPRLAALSGPAFDALYKSTQAVALRQLADAYQAYATTGTDSSLRTLALRQLPLMQARLAEIEKI